jgi:hypothetical protein
MELVPALLLFPVLDAETHFAAALADFCGCKAGGEELRNISQGGSADTERALDDPGLAADGLCDVERGGLPLPERPHRYCHGNFGLTR